MTVTAELVDERYQREADHRLTMTLVLHFHGATAHDLLDAFFFEGFYSDRPILKDMMCTKESHTYVGGSGSFYEIEEFRPQAMRHLPSFGSKFRLDWEGETIVGRMRGAFWAVNWRSVFEPLPAPATGVRMTETFVIEGFPEPVGDDPSPTRRLFRQFVALSNRIPGIRVINKRIASRVCAIVHKKFAPYEEMIPPRLAKRNARLAEV